MTHYNQIMAVLALFAAICVALGYVIWIVKGVRKPYTTVSQKIAEDEDRLNRLEEQMNHLDQSVSLLLKSEFVTLEHMRTNNNTGEIAKMENELKQFLIEN